MIKKNSFSTLPLFLLCLMAFGIFSVPNADAQVMGGSVPNWAIGTFYGRNNNGNTITLSINNNGNVIDHVNGITTTGRVVGNTLMFDNGPQRQMMQINNGFATMIGNGMRIEFTKSGGWNQGGGGQPSVPGWVIGTFYGRNNNGDTITLTIGSSGRVIDHVNGFTTYGTISGNNLTFDDGSSRRLTQANNGFTAVQGNGMRVNFSRNGAWNSGGGNGGGQQNRVPNWAIGTFYGQNSNGNTITLTVNNSGNVVDHVNGITSYGTIAGNTLTFSGAAPRRLIQTNDGFTTVQGNGMRINFSR